MMMILEENSPEYKKNISLFSKTEEEEEANERKKDGYKKGDGWEANDVMSKISMTFGDVCGGGEALQCNVQKVHRYICMCVM